MKALLESLASLKFSVGILVLLLLTLGTGTIVETRLGAEEAGRFVYHSWWLFGLLELLCASVLSSAYLHYPWSKRRYGYAATHLGIALILCGATVTYQYGVDGELVVWKGQVTGEVIKRDSRGNTLRNTRLPFDVALEDFRITHYPGTEQPSGYQSDVLIIDPSLGTFGADIWMNHGFSYKGWHFYQSSYRLEEDGAVASILSASNDPGQPWVYSGYGVLLVGMGLVIATRLARGRTSTITTTPIYPGRDTRVTFALASLIVLVVCSAVFMSVRAPRTDENTERLRRLPVQYDGRVMPLDTLARESVFKITGMRRWQGQDPLKTVLTWLYDTEKTPYERVVKFDGKTLGPVLGIPSTTPFLSAQEFDPQRTHLRQLFEDANAKGNPLSRLRSATLEHEERFQRLLSLIRGDVIRCLPPSPGSDAWTSPNTTSRSALLAIAKGAHKPQWPSTSSIDRELLYNRLQPTRLSWIVLIGTFSLAMLGWLRKQQKLDHVAFIGLVIGAAIMTWGLVVRWQIAGRIPASDMHESLLFLAWGIGFLALALYPIMKSNLIVINASGLCALTMLLNDQLPIDPFVHPMPPVLSGTPWLAIHVPIIMLSYSVLALGVVVAHALLAVQIAAPNRVDTLERLYRTLHWYLHVGCWLLAAGIITGSIWAASSWGRYWGWDPKEVWSLVALLAYLAILHGRIEKLVGAFGVAACSILAFQTILMTYLGVNFLLGTGMHSYGMSDSPIAKWLILVVVVELAFLLVAWVTRKRRESNAVQAEITV